MSIKKKKLQFWKKTYVIRQLVSYILASKNLLLFVHFKLTTVTRWRKRLVCYRLKWHDHAQDKLGELQSCTEHSSTYPGYSIE